MDKLLTALPALGCVIGMPLMMVIMMRGRGSHDNAPQNDASEAAQLRAEVHQLRKEVADRGDVAS
jgi:hypothetical protein